MFQLYITVFWTSLVILFYGYIGYGVILTLIGEIKKGKSPPLSKNIIHFPTVALIIAAYNEEKTIKSKIENSLSLNYPKNKLRIYLITDGSTDRTVEYSREYPEVTLFHKEKRIGKLSSIQRIIPDLNEDILLFSDANCLLNNEAVHYLIQHFNDPGVGAVSGEKKILSTGTSSDTEGLYWKYESWLKRLDSDFYTLVGAAGELFCIRRELYELLPGNVILEDFVQSMKVCGKGLKVFYEHRAFAIEAPSQTLAEEFERKTRICAGAFQSFKYIKFAFNPFKNFKLFFQFFSHRVLRWTLCPLALLMILLANFQILENNSFYRAMFILQALLYIWAIAGFILSLKKIRGGFFYVPMYFLMMNLAVFAGFFRFITGRQSNIWLKAERKTALNQ